MGHAATTKPEVSEEEETIANALMGHTLPPSLPLFSQHNTTIDANKYLCRTQMPEELQGKQTGAVGTVLHLSLYSEEVEKEVMQIIDNKNRDRKQ